MTMNIIQELNKQDRECPACHKSLMAFEDLGTNFWECQNTECDAHFTYWKVTEREIKSAQRNIARFYAWREKFFLCHPNTEQAREAWDATRNRNNGSKLREEVP